MSGLTSYTPPRETLAATFSRSNSEGLAVHVVLVHLRVVFYLCTCEPRGSVAALISYDHVKFAVGTNTKRR
jgi:hypothetical protein